MKDISPELREKLWRRAQEINLQARYLFDNRRTTPLNYTTWLRLETRLSRILYTLDPTDPPF